MLNELLKNKNYDFLYNKEINRLLIFALSGSYAYGLNTKDSDLDIRGVAYNTIEKLLGLSKFEQFVDDKTDTVIFSFSKIIPLLINNNPNTLEIFGNKPEHYLYISKHGQLLKDNINIFLSQNAIKSFSGYAIAQLRRLQNAIARDALSDHEMNEYIKKTLNNNIIHFKNTYTDFDYGGIKFNNEDELTITVNLNNYPMKDLVSMFSEMNAIVKDFTKIKHRNNKKDSIHLNKHASHIIRLLYTGIDVLESRGIITYREKEHDLLMDIKNGKFLLPDNTYDSAFFDLVDKLENDFEYAKKNTSLPQHPDMKKIEEIVMTINKSVLFKDLSK